MPKAVRYNFAFKELAKDKSDVTVTEHDWTVGQMIEMSKMGLEPCLDKMTARCVKRLAG